MAPPEYLWFLMSLSMASSSERLLETAAAMTVYVQKGLGLADFWRNVLAITQQCAHVHSSQSESPADEDSVLLALILQKLKAFYPSMIYRTAGLGKILLKCI